MKSILGVTIVFLCGFIGLSIKNIIYKKYQFYNEINMFFHYISIKIAFFNDMYADCISNFINSNNLKNKFFFECLLNIIINSELTKENFNKAINISLSIHEKEELFTMFSSIGTTDIQNQNIIISGNIKQLELKLSQLSQLKKTKGDVFGKLGICIGLVICILIY